MTGEEILAIFHLQQFVLKLSLSRCFQILLGNPLKQDFWKLAKGWTHLLRTFLSLPLLFNPRYRFTRFYTTKWAIKGAITLLKTFVCLFLKKYWWGLLRLNSSTVGKILWKTEFAPTFYCLKFTQHVIFTEFVIKVSKAI